MRGGARLAMIEHGLVIPASLLLYESATCRIKTL